MVYLPPDQREKLAHILLDIEDAERSEKLLRDLVVDVNGSRSAESLIRACSAATACWSSPTARCSPSTA